MAIGFVIPRDVGRILERVAFWTRPALRVPCVASDLGGYANRPKSAASAQSSGPITSGILRQTDFAGYGVFGALPPPGVARRSGWCHHRPHRNSTMVKIWSGSLMRRLAAGPCLVLLIWIASVFGQSAATIEGVSAEFEPLYRQALAIRERRLGPDHPKVAESLTNLALLLRNHGDLSAAEPLLRRALAIRESALGPRDVRIAADLENLASLLEARRDVGGAESLYRRALALREKAGRAAGLDLAATVTRLAALLENSGDLDGAVS